MLVTTHSGLRDWLIQRVSAVILAAYTLFLLLFFLTHAQVDYETWGNLFSHTAVRLFTLVFLLSLVWHVWIGLWIVATDYLKPTAVRLLFQVFVMLTLLVCLIWAVEILWGVGV